MDPVLVRSVRALLAALGPKYYVTDGYRTREQQEELYRRKPRFAAKPGTSQHEFGRAVDLQPHDFDPRILSKFGLRAIAGEPWHLQRI